MHNYLNNFKSYEHFIKVFSMNFYCCFFYEQKKPWNFLTSLFTILFIDFLLKLLKLMSRLCIK